MADPDRRWPALDLVARGHSGSPVQSESQSESESESGASPAISQGEASSPRAESPAWLEPAASPDGSPLSAGTPPIDGYLAAFLDDYAPTAIVDPPIAPEDGGPAWRVFFVDAAARDRAAAAIAASPVWRERLSVTTVDVEDEGWAERSQAALTAITIGNLIVAPPWDVPGAASRADAVLLDAAASSAAVQSDVARANAAPRVIIIEPSMGFGTGHHQSTRLCLLALQAIDLSGARVLDLGTGSGVLAIAAGALGAASVAGWDDDPDAVDAARTNVTLNGLDDRVTIARVDLTSAPPQQADLILANLTGALLARHAAAIVHHAAPGARLVVSGFTEDERYTVRHAFRDLTEIRAESEDGWLGLTLQVAAA